MFRPGTPFRSAFIPWVILAAGLLSSCDSPQKQALRELSASGFDPSGITLVKAVADRDPHRAALLLEAGVYTEQRDPQGRTPLAIAVEQADLPLLAMLLNAGAKPNAVLANSSSVLGMAALRGDMLMFDTLLSAGARTDGLMPDGEMILPWAIHQGRADLVSRMMKADPDPHLKDRHGTPLLHIAMKAARRDLMETLISLGADPSAASPDGQTTIQLALKHGWHDAIPKLAAAGADPNAPDAQGLRPLDRALASRDLPMAELFLKAGADPSLPASGNDSSKSPLRIAFEQTDPRFLELFLSRGAKIPESWLWDAFHARDLQTTRLLFKHGVRPRETQPTMLEQAVQASSIPFAKLLLDYGLPPGRSLALACSRDDAAMAELLLCYGTPPDFTRFPTFDTLLSTTLRARHDRCAEVLLRHGADPHLRISGGQSLFLLAVATGSHRSVRHMLAQGADPNEAFKLPVSPEFLRHVRPGVMRWVLKMDRNATPLMMAADSGSIPTTRYLIQAGAKLQVRTKVASLWPINFASRRNDVPMMRLFLGKDPLREERRIEVRLSEQKARILDAAGNEILTTRISTGRKGYATPTGEYVITNKHREWKSTLYHASMPFFQRLSCGDFGLHQGNVPGYPASHGCIRVPAGTAEKLFSLTKTGDRVLILP
jgi:ankyrin repeat protein